MPELYPPFMVGDRIETWDYHNHGRAAGDSTFGTIVSLNPIKIRTDKGGVIGEGESIRVVTPVARPKFDFAANKWAFKSAIASVQATEKLKKAAEDQHRAAQKALDGLRANLRANGGPCPHPADMQANNQCLACGHWDDPYY